VVDNASEDDDISNLYTLGHKVLEIICSNTNLGYAGGNNLGIKHALKKTNSDYILIINPDVIVAPEFLIKLIQFMEKDAKIGIAAPIQCYMIKPKVVYTAGGRLWWFLGQHQMLDNGVPLERIKNTKACPLKVDFVSGACMLIRRTLLNKSLLPEEYFLQWEDIDYCTHVRRLGYDVMVVPASVVWHKIGLTVQQGNGVYDMVRRAMRNRFIFFLKYTDGLLARLAWLTLFSFITFPTYLIYGIFVRRDIRRAKALLAGFREGLRYANKEVWRGLT